MKQSLLLIAGWLALIAALIGILLPLLPTTPFLLLSALCFSRSSPRLQRWITNHPWFGPSIRQWQQHRSVARHIKIKALSLLVGSFAISLILVPLSPLGKDLLLLLALVLMGFIIRLPERNPPDEWNHTDLSRDKPTSREEA